MGPFTFEARQMILRRLLETQLEIQKFYPELDLITLDDIIRVLPSGKCDVDEEYHLRKKYEKN